MFFIIRDSFISEKRSIEKSILYIVVCSAIVKVITDAIISLLPSGNVVLQQYVNLIRIIYILLAIVVSFIEYKLRRSSKVSAFLSNHFGIAARPNVWLRFIGTDGKTYVSITTDTGDKIFGSPQFISDDYVAMTKYGIEDKDGNRKATKGTAIIIPQNTIKRIETIYDEGSEILKIDKEKSKHK